MNWGSERISWLCRGQFCLFASLFHRSYHHFACWSPTVEEILKPIVKCKNKGAVTTIYHGGPDQSTKYFTDENVSHLMWSKRKFSLMLRECASKAINFQISREPILSSIVIFCRLYKTKILSKGYVVGVMWCLMCQN